MTVAVNNASWHTVKKVNMLTMWFGAQLFTVVSQTAVTLTHFKKLHFKTAITFKTRVFGVESNKSGLAHVVGQVLCKGFWVGGRKGKHLFVRW